MTRLVSPWAHRDPAWGITIVRLIMAFVLIVTGYQKFTAGVDRVTAIMVHDGIPLPTAAGIAIIALELLGGILLLVGLGGHILGLLYLAEFVVVSFYVQLPTEGLMAARLPIMLLAGALMLTIAGSGRLSLDRLLSRSRGGGGQSGAVDGARLQHMAPPRTL